MQFRTLRTTLRIYDPSIHKEYLLSLWSDTDIQRCVFNEAIVSYGPRVVQEKVDILTRGRSLFAIIENRATGELMGHVGLSIQEPSNGCGVASIALARVHWSKGYGTEVMRWLVGYGFKYEKLSRIALNVFEENERAISLYRKMSVFFIRTTDRADAHTRGFIHEGVSKQSNWREGKWMGAVLMSLLVQEWDFEKERRRVPPD